MKRWKLLSGAVVVGCIAMGVHAEDKKVTFFGAIEYLTYSDAFEKNEKAFNDGSKIATASEIEWGPGDGHDINNLDADQTLTSDTKKSDGTGFRIGALALTPVKGLKVGGSLGYVMGPSFEGNQTVNADNGVDSYSDHYKWKDESNLWRVMAESKYSYPLGEKFQARLGFAIGVASVKVTEKYSNDYSDSDGFTTSASSNQSMTTTKLTWEVGPAIAFVTEKVGVELALTYAQMPTAKNSQTFQEFKWNPFGIRLGVEF